MENYGVASKLPVDRERVDLAVGNDLNAINVGLNQGRAPYGGTLSGNLSGPYMLSLRSCSVSGGGVRHGWLVLGSATG